MRTLLLAFGSFALAFTLMGQKVSESEQWRDVYDSLRGVSSLRPKSGFIPNEVTAIKVAEAVAIAQLGEAQIATERPFKADLRGDAWTVVGTLHPEGVPGGTAVIRLSKSTGAVLFAIHQQ